MSSEPFEVWRRRLEVEPESVTLIDLYRAVAQSKGLAAHELSRGERTELSNKALPLMWPGYQVPPGTDRAEADPIEIVPYDLAWPGQFRKWRERLAEALGATARRIEHIGS